MREAVQGKRPLGEARPVTEDDLWEQAVKDMADKPRKSLAIDLLNDVLSNQDALIDDLLRLDQRLQKVEATPRNFAAEIFGKVQEIQLRDTASWRSRARASNGRSMPARMCWPACGTTWRKRCGICGSSICCKILGSTRLGSTGQVLSRVSVFDIGLAGIRGVLGLRSNTPVTSRHLTAQI